MGVGKGKGVWVGIGVGVGVGVGIGVGAFSAIIHLPVKEIPLTERRLLTN